MTRPALIAALAVSGVLLSSCGGTPPTSVTSAPTPQASGGTTAPAAAPSAAADPNASPPPCPSASVAPVAGSTLPAAVPEDLPLPPEASVTEVTQENGGLTVVRFSTPDSLRQSILFVLDALPANGYVLGRGDAESFEADAPFTRGTLRGVMRMVATEECRTDWLLAVADDAAGGSPVVPQFSPSPTASALPFG